MAVKTYLRLTAIKILAQKMHNIQRFLIKSEAILCGEHFPFDSEHVLGKDEVTGSNPVSSSKRKRNGSLCRFFFVRNHVNIESVTESVLGLRQQTDEARSVKKTGLNVLFLAERGAICNCDRGVALRKQDSMSCFQRSGEQFTIATGAQRIENRTQCPVFSEAGELYY